MRRFFIPMFLFLVLFSFSVEAADKTETISRERNKIIFLNTLPKSGSLFISHVLTSQTGYPGVRISLSRFHDDYIQEDQIRKFFSLNCITQEHIDASNENVQILEKYFSKMILHLRDPRQELISWFHHVEKLQTSDYGIWSQDICPPEDYFIWSLEEKLDWQIENFLPCTIKWIQDWCDVIDSNNNIKVLVTNFEDMKRNPEEFFIQIADFYELPIKQFSIPAFSQNKLHQRKGQIDEWKKVLNNRQKERIAKMIPQTLMERFG